MSKIKFQMAEQKKNECVRDEDVYKNMTEIWTDEYTWEYEYLLLFQTTFMKIHFPK